MTEGRPVLNQVNIVVNDMDAAVAFYQQLGLDVGDAPPEWQPHHRTAATPDGFVIDFDSEASARLWDEGWPGGTGVVVGFRLPSRQAVDDLYAKLTGQGHRSQQAPYDAFWGARYAIIEDPSGNAVGLMSPIDPERRSPPPSPS